MFHNAVLASEQGGESRNSVVLTIHAMTNRAATEDDSCASDQSRPLVVAVCSYGFDEPIDLILEASALVPQIDVVMTGRPPAGLSLKAPSNVQFTGWLSEQDYNDAIAKASAIICLTTREATMQNGLVEALEHRRPVITSNTRALREWAKDVPGIVTIDHTPNELAATITTIAGDREGWRRRATEGQQVALSRAQMELCLLQDALKMAESP